ncbi:MAG: Rrf2 family transcriptional regulator [Cyanobium sp. LacPavin_0818_WC50_MAG_67_9]|nr:Rrf2 family transcriptional regulator [Cyanobium sp. LacPavin_0818_WC50_MAG_67_9]
MLRKSGIQALKALLELAQAPAQWRSAQELAEAQQLPAAMVEQVLLRLRRAEVLEARRGRNGGYRLARPARQIVLTEVLAAAAAVPAAGAAGLSEAENQPGDQVTAALEKRLARSLTQVLSQLTLEDLLFDLRSAEACLEDDGGLMLG